MEGSDIRFQKLMDDILDERPYYSNHNQVKPTSAAVYFNVNQTKPVSGISMVGITPDDINSPETSFRVGYYNELSKQIKKEEVPLKKSFNGDGTFDKSKNEKKKKRFFFF